MLAANSHPWPAPAHIPIAPPQHCPSCRHLAARASNPTAPHDAGTTGATQGKQGADRATSLYSSTPRPELTRSLTPALIGADISRSDRPDWNVRAGAFHTRQRFWPVIEERCTSKSAPRPQPSPAGRGSKKAHLPALAVCPRVCPHLPCYAAIRRVAPMHPTPRSAPLGAAATRLAAPARRGPVVPSNVMESHIDGLPGIRLRVLAA